jgi:hypothetical protein
VLQVKSQVVLLAQITVPLVGAAGHGVQRVPQVSTELVGAHAPEQT